MKNCQIWVLKAREIQSVLKLSLIFRRSRHALRFLAKNIIYLITFAFTFFFFASFYKLVSKEEICLLCNDPRKKSQTKVQHSNLICVLPSHTCKLNVQISSARCLGKTVVIGNIYLGKYNVATATKSTGWGFLWRRPKGLLNSQIHPKEEHQESEVHPQKICGAH